MARANSSDDTTADRNDDLPPRGDDIRGDFKEKDLVEVYKNALAGYEDKRDRANDIERFWRVYNCILTVNQAYSGRTSVYLPIVHDAIEARVQRFVNMLFPENGRYTEVISNVDNKPHAIQGLLDHYVRRSRSKIKAKQLLRNGEVEGQYSIYVHWHENKRYVTRNVEKHPEIEKGIHDPTTTIRDPEDDEIVDAYPTFEVLSDADVCVLPATCEDIEEDAEVVAVRRWLTKSAIQKYVREGLFDKKQAKILEKKIDDTDPNQIKNPGKDQADAAGVKLKAGKIVALVFEVWKKFDVKKKHRWTRTFFAGEDLVLGMQVNPNWEDRCAVISKARNKVDGSFWGKSPVDSVEQLQYMANDWINMAGDNGMYSLLPVVLTDPEKNPNYASMVMNLAAVWQADPNSTKTMEFPQLWKDALQFVAACRDQVLQAFSLNPAMITMGSGTGKKQSQAQVAQEQMVMLASITDEVSTLEDEIFTPLLQRYFELDQQNRDDETTVKIYGQMGIAASMEAVPPFAWDDRYEFMWRGSQTIRSAQNSQQMIAGMNILRSLPPTLPDGKRIDLTPIIETLVENIYGPRLGAKILIDARDQMTVPPDLENQLMAGGVQVLVHPQDNDPEHLQSHTMFMQQTGDPTGLVRAHIQATQAAMAQKMQQMQGAPGGLPGAPGKPGVAGTPRPGAQPAQPRGGQNPAGAMHADRMQDSGMMPRQAG